MREAVIVEAVRTPIARGKAGKGALSMFHPANLLAKVQEAYAGDAKVLILSHSVTPKLDTVPVLREYADRLGIRDGKWHLTTGSRDVIYELARKSYFAEKASGYAKGANDFLHSELFLLLDAERRIRGVYNGTRGMDVRRLVEDIATLRKS